MSRVLDDLNSETAGPVVMVAVSAQTGHEGARFVTRGRLSSGSVVDGTDRGMAGRPDASDGVRKWKGSAHWRLRPYQ